MFSSRMSQVVCSIKEMLVKPNSFWDYKRAEDGTITTPGMRITLDLRLSHYHPVGKYREFNVSEMVYFLFTGTTVWVGFEQRDDSRRREPTFGEYRFLSSHDSCWRDAVDQEITKIYFACASKINDDLVKAGHKKIAPKDMNDNSSLGWLGNPWKLVNVTWKTDPQDSYKKILVKYEDKSNE